MPSSLSVSPLTRSVTLEMARSPSDLSTSCPTSLRRDMGSAVLFATAHHLLDRLLAERELLAFLALPRDDFFAGERLAADFRGGELFLADVRFDVVFLADEDRLAADFFAVDRPPEDLRP